jgi:hypothetical protein
VGQETLSQQHIRSPRKHRNHSTQPEVKAGKDPAITKVWLIAGPKNQKRRLYPFSVSEAKIAANRVAAQAPQDRGNTEVSR